VTACEVVHELAAEAALGLLAGSERAEVLAHLDACEKCRELVHELGGVADDVMLLAPAAEPPVGFEERVLAHLDVARRRRWPMFVRAAAAVVVVVMGFVIGRASSPSGEEQRELTMRAPSGQVVGDAYVHDGAPAWVFVSVPGWTTGPSQYRLRVTLTNGSTTEVPGGDLGAGAGSWGTILNLDGAQVRELSLIDADGTVWCSASIS
jgi:anti-sigma factor RsiW